MNDEQRTAIRGLEIMMTHTDEDIRKHENGTITGCALAARLEARLQHYHGAGLVLTGEAMTLCFSMTRKVNELLAGITFEEDS